MRGLPDWRQCCSPSPLLFRWSLLKIPQLWSPVSSRFFDPGASTSVMSSGLVTEGAGSSLAQTTGETAVLYATQPVEAPGTRSEAVIRVATCPVEGPGTRVLATQPVEAPGAGPEVLLTSTGSDAAQLDRSLTDGKPDDVTGTGVSESDEEMASELGSPVDSNVQGEFTEDQADQPVTERLSEESDRSWAGTRSLTLTVLHLHFMITRLPVPKSSQPGKYQ